MISTNVISISHFADLRTDLKSLFQDNDTNSVHSMDDDLESMDSGSSPHSAKGGRSSSGVITGRGITLMTLMNDGIVEAGEGCLAVDYLVSCMSVKILIPC